MKKLLLFLLSLPLGISAQTFSYNTWTQIPNTNTDLLIPIQVSGLPQHIDTAFGLGAVCLRITHQFTADLQIKLQSPDGKRITLVDTKGGSSTGYPNTCFVENASNGWIQLAAPPFSGSYFPQQSLNVFNDRSDPNGTWYLILRDVFTPADTGSLHYVNISFLMRPPIDPVASRFPCSDANPAGCQCPDGFSQDCDLLPDMTSSAACIQGDYLEYPGNITLSNATPNIGSGPLEIHGTGSCYCDSLPVPCSTTNCPSGSYPKELITQRVYHRDGNSMSYYDRPAGTMTYHPSHGHVHVDNWAFFSLRRWSPDPDARNWPIIGVGTKQSFCLVNLGDCDNNFGYCVDENGNSLHKADIPNSDFGTVTGCSRDQGIYVGNLDIYSSSLNGMGIVLPGTTCNGNYYIVSITDPENNMLESNDDNNWVQVPVTLTQQSAGSFPASGFSYNVNGYVANFISNALGTDSIVWKWGDGTTTVTNVGGSTSHTFPGSGQYIVYSFAYNLCGPTVSADTVIILPVTTNVQSTETVVSFKAYPNPSKGQFNISYSLVNSSPVSIELFDALGNYIKTFTNQDQNPGKYQFGMDSKLLGMNAGIYFLKLRTNNKNLVIRLVVL